MLESRAVVDTLSSIVSQQSRFFDCRHAIPTRRSELPCRDCHDLEGTAVDREMTVATAALLERLPCKNTDNDCTLWEGINAQVFSSFLLQSCG